MGAFRGGGEYAWILCLSGAGGGFGETICGRRGYLGEDETARSGAGKRIGLLLRRECCMYTYF